MKFSPKFALGSLLLCIGFQGCKKEEKKAKTAVQPNTCEYRVTDTPEGKIPFTLEIKRRGNEKTAYEIYSVQCGGLEDGTPNEYNAANGNPFTHPIQAAFLTIVDSIEAPDCDDVFAAVLRRIQEYQEKNDVGASAWNNGKKFSNMNEVVNLVCGSFRPGDTRSASHPGIDQENAEAFRDLGTSGSNKTPEGSTNGAPAERSGQASQPGQAPVPAAAAAIPATAAAAIPVTAAAAAIPAAAAAPAAASTASAKPHFPVVPAKPPTVTSVSPSQAPEALQEMRESGVLSAMAGAAGDDPVQKSKQGTSEAALREKVIAEGSPHQAAKQLKAIEEYKKTMDNVETAVGQLRGGGAAGTPVNAPPKQK